MPADANWKDILRIGERYKVIPLLYQGVTNSEISVPETVMGRMQNIVLSNLMLDQKQLYELSNLQKAFDENGIDYMPVKGILMKDLYPNTELRPMGDGDILIRMTQKEKIADAMDRLGYVFAYESTHEWAFDKNGVHVELHKRLIPLQNTDYCAYYGDGWKFAKETGNGTRYALSDEDHYIYIFTHFAKHYRDGGIGVLHMADLWIYTREKNVQTPYVRAELEKLDLLRFYDNVFETIHAWFEGGPQTEMTEFITRRIFSYGRWGTETSRIMAKGVRDSKSVPLGKLRVKQITEAMFPGMLRMQYRYPILQKYGFLLPVMWIARWFDFLLFKHDRIRDKVKAIKISTEDNVSAYQNELDYVGLDYNF
ncbi:MAG: nucleotidyltransferase family protein [Clostridia bacterium]|nr:nucleotidyltransferase family protein [Clostridia bacterium]